MRPRYFLATAATALILGAAPQVQAQNQQVVPKIYKDLEAYGSQNYPFSYTMVHFQELLLGTEIAKTGAQISGMRFRRDGVTTTSYLAKSSNFDITFYNTSLTPSTMSKTWASNRGTTPGVKVFSGTVNLPASTAPATIPAPWVVNIAFKAPYIYTVAKGNLCIEVLNGATYVYSRWSSDCTRQSTTSGGGEEGYVGLGCIGSGNQKAKIAIDEHTLCPGGKIDVKVTFTGLTSSIVLLGMSKNNFNSIPLPFNLTPLGATNCYLYNDIVSSLPVNTSATSAIWNIPNISFLAGAMTYVQAVGLAVGANPAGVVTSAGRFAKLGTGSPGSGNVECVFRIKDNVNPTGYQAGSTLNTAPVILFDGVFF